MIEAPSSRGPGGPLRLITELTEELCAAWDGYVEQAAHGLPQHLSGWREVLYKTHGYETRYLMAREGERIVGVLPLFLVRSVLVGNTAMTMPGGLCADTAEIALELISRGQEIARQAKVKRFLIQDTRQLWPADLQTSANHVHWIINTQPDVDELWQQLNGNIRRQVRIARRNELSLQIDRVGELLGTFYDTFSRFTHQLGTPIFGRDFLEHVVEAFPGGFNIAVVYKEQQPLGGYFQLQLGRTMYGVWGASLREFLELRPAYLAHWEIVRDASLNGYHALDMGRSPTGSSAAQYKGQWGGVSKPIYQQVAAIGQARSAESIVNKVQTDGKFQFMMRLWPKLPLPIIRYVGPKLRRHVPFA